MQFDLNIKLLKYFPPVRMMTGSLDPLHDECWRFAEKLLFFLLFFSEILNDFNMV